MKLIVLRDEEDQATDAEVDADNVSVASVGSTTSQATVTPENVSSSSAPAGTSNDNAAPSPLRRSRTVSTTHVPQV